MGASASVATVLRMHGLAFARNLQASLRMVIMFGLEHKQTTPVVQRALASLNQVLKETGTLSVGFQFDRVLLNSLPLADPNLSWLAAELTKRGIGFLVFSQGLDEEGFGRVLKVLATRPETIEQDGGLATFLRSHPLPFTRLVPVQSAAADGASAIVTSAEEAAAIARIPRWLLRALEEAHGAGESRLVSALELSELASTLNPDLTPEQRVLLPQMQDLLTRVVQRADTTALAQLVRVTSSEVGAAGEELLQSVMRQALEASATAGEAPQCERILRSALKLQLQPESLVQMLPSDKVSPELRDGLTAYARWAERPLSDRVAEVEQFTSPNQFRWLVLEIEHLILEDQARPAAELLAGMFSAPGPADDVGRADVLTRARHLLAMMLTRYLPDNAVQLLDVLAARLREETVPITCTPLLDSVAALSQAAADRNQLVLAGHAAAVVGEFADELSPRGKLAAQARTRLLKPATLSHLIDSCIAPKPDPGANRTIIPLLKKVGDPAAREMFALLEKEKVTAKRMRILQVLKLMGRAAIDTLTEKISDPQWYVVRNAVVALAELADPSLLDRLEPALSHEDERVQKAAVAAVQKARSSEGGGLLARALPALKPAVLDTVLDELLALKEPEAVPYLEQIARRPAGDIPAASASSPAHVRGLWQGRPHQVLKAISVLGAIDTEEAALSLAKCMDDADLAMPARMAAVRALGRLQTPAARQAIEQFAGNSSDAALAAEARKLLG